jgi:hypothetical protein
LLRAALDGAPRVISSQPKKEEGTGKNAGATQDQK